MWSISYHLWAKCASIYLQFNETDIFRLRFDYLGEYIYGFFMWSQQTNLMKSR